MTQAAASLPTTVRMQVCGECLPRLEALGAVRVPGPHVIALDTRCELHGRTGALAASRVVDLSAELADRLEREVAKQPLSPLELEDDAADAPLVAQLAVSFIGAKELDPSDDAIAVAVRFARRVLAAARGK